MDAGPEGAGTASRDGEGGRGGLRLREGGHWGSVKGQGLVRGARFNEEAETRKGRGGSKERPLNMKDSTPPELDGEERWGGAWGE